MKRRPNGCPAENLAGHPLFVGFLDYRKTVGVEIEEIRL